MFTQFGRYAGETGGTFKAALQQAFGADDGRVIGLRHNSGERNGTQLDTDCCIVFEVEDGRGAERHLSGRTGTLRSRSRCDRPQD